MSCDERTTGKMIEILVKYMVLRGCSEPLKVHFLERNIKSLSMEEFQEVGVAFQSAHGRINSTNVTMRQYHRQPQEATMQAWRVSVEETLSKLEKMSVERRRSYVLENRLCFACLKKGHRAWDCHTKNSCGKCGGRHHSLLHAQSAPMEFEKTNVSMISSFSKPTKPADVLLMTAALDVVGRDGKKHASAHFLTRERKRLLCLRNWSKLRRFRKSNKLDCPYKVSEHLLSWYRLPFIKLRSLIVSARTTR